MDNLSRADMLFNRIVDLYGKGTKTKYKFRQFLESAEYTGVEVEVGKIAFNNPVFAIRKEGELSYLTMFQTRPEEKWNDNKILEYFEIKLAPDRTYYTTPGSSYRDLESHSSMSTMHDWIDIIFNVLRDSLIH